MKKGNKILKTIGILLAVLIAGLAILYVMLPGIVLKQVNKQLPENLNAEASLGDIELNLLGGYAAINNLHISQPPGFGDTPFVDAKHAEVQLAMSSLNSSLIVVKRILLDGAEINLVKNKEGKMNVESLAKQKPGSAAKPSPTGDASPTAKAEPAEVKPVLLENIQLKNVKFTFRDEGVGEHGLDIVLTDINADIEGLLIDSNAEDSSENAATAAITAQFGQRKFPTAPLAVYASLGPIIATNIPSVNAAVRLVGFELTPLVNFPGLKSVLGGNALDLSAELGVRQDLLDCQVTAKMDSGQVHRQKVGGTPLKPDYDKDQALGLVFGRFSGVLGNTVGNVAETGKEAVAAVTDTATEAVKDAGKTVSGFGKGLFKTIKSVATLDVEGAASNLTETAVGTVQSATDTVAGAATNLTTGVTEAASNVTGATGSNAFRAEVKTRADTLFAEAETWTGKQVFPPVRQFSKK